MFIFERPWRGVAAGLAVALLILAWDRLCCPPAAPALPAGSQLPQSAACPAPGGCGIVRAGS